MPEVAWPKNEPRPEIRNQKIIAPTTGPRTRAAPPMQQGGVGEERHVGGVVGRDDRGLLEGQEQAGEAAEHAPEDERLHLVGEDVLAERAHGVLVLADRARARGPTGCASAPRR